MAGEKGKYGGKREKRKKSEIQERSLRKSRRRLIRVTTRGHRDGGKGGKHFARMKRGVIRRRKQKTAGGKK